MIIFLYGEDTYRLLRSRDEIVEKYKAKHGSGFNFFRVDAALPTAVPQITEAVKSVSLFSEVKMILATNVFSNIQNAEQIQELISKYKIATDLAVVILATHNGTIAQAKPKELFSLLITKGNLVREFKPLDGSVLQNWLKKEAIDLGVSFAPDVLNRFILATAGQDSWGKINNLQKLANYTRNQITVADVDLLVKTETEPNIFEFIDALGSCATPEASARRSGRRDQAFSLLCGELAFGREPYYLLTMAMYQFRNMLIVKDLSDRNFSQAQIAQKAGIHPFVVKKMLASTAHLSLADIKRLYQEVLDLEQGTKQGHRDLEDGLFGLALN